MTDEAGDAQNQPQGQPQNGPENGPGDRPADAPGGGPEQGVPEKENPWRALHLWQIQPIRDVLMIAGVLGLFWLGAKLSVVTVPLLLAILFAYLFEPIVHQMTRVGWITRRIAALVIIFFFGFIIVLPAAVGLAVGVVQGVTYAARVADNIDSVFKSSSEPERTELYDDLPGDFWRSLHDMLVEWRRDGDGDEIIEEVGKTLRGEESDEPETEEDKGEAPEEGDEGDEAGERGERNERDERGELDDRGERSERDEFDEWVGRGGPDQRDEQEGSDDPFFAEDFEPPGLQERGALVEFALNWIRANAQAIASRAFRTGAGAVEAAFSGLVSLASFAFMLFLTAFFFLFISPSFKSVIDFGRSLVPDKNRERVVDLVIQMDGVVSAFVRGRLTIAVILSVYLTIGYAAVGVPVPFLMGPLVGVLSVIPYLGMIGLPITVIAMLLQPGPTMFEFQEATWWAIIGPYIIWQIAQVGDDYFLTPVIQGKGVNMDTPTILFAVLAGGALAGFYGVLVAIPVAACLKILTREVFWPGFNRWVRGQEKDFLPISRD